VDGPEEVELIVLLAIPPAEAGSTHIQVLTELTSRLADDVLRERVMAAETAEDLLDALNGVSKEDEADTPVNAPTVVCVTACPAGIAHTYMAAEYLEKAGRKLGVNVVVEKQGANGIEGRITAQQLQEAKACIFAAEVAIKESERFQGIPAISARCGTLRHAEALIERALALKPSPMRAMRRSIPKRKSALKLSSSRRFSAASLLRCR
jgi:2-O-A-mannosyl-D-glycerate-specific PTS system IIC component